MLCEEARLKRTHTTGFHLYDIIGWRTNQWLPQVKEVGGVHHKRAARGNLLGVRNQSCILCGDYMTLKSKLFKFKELYPKRVNFTIYKFCLSPNVDLSLILCFSIPLTCSKLLATLYTMTPPFPPSSHLLAALASI